MANSATAQAALPIKYAGVSAVIPYAIVIDTTAQDLIVRAPADGSHAAIVGLFYRETSAHVLTIKSGTTTLVAIEHVAADAPGYYGIGSGILAMTAAGEDLIIQSSVAISTMLMHVIEGNSFFIK